jgi:hypothetical protein
VQDAGEPGIPGITVTLERFINGEWTCQIATTTTDANGAYGFTGLSAGDYRVTVDTASQISSPYAQGTFALGDVMAPTFDADGHVATPHVALVTLATDSTVIDTTDFGYNWSGSHRRLVWWDDNTNGLQDETRSRHPGRPRPWSTSTRISTASSTASLGDYQILRRLHRRQRLLPHPNLPPGNYFVDVYEDSMVTDGIRNVVPTTDNVVPVVLARAT